MKSAPKFVFNFQSAFLGIGIFYSITKFFNWPFYSQNFTKIKISQIFLETFDSCDENQILQEYGKSLFGNSYQYDPNRVPNGNDINIKEAQTLINDKFKELQLSHQKAFIPKENGFSSNKDLDSVSIFLKNVIFFNKLQTFVINKVTLDESFEFFDAFSKSSTIPNDTISANWSLRAKAAVEVAATAKLLLKLLESSDLATTILDTKASVVYQNLVNNLSETANKTTNMVLPSKEFEGNLETILTKMTTLLVEQINAQNKELFDKFSLVAQNLVNSQTNKEIKELTTELGVANQKLQLVNEEKNALQENFDKSNLKDKILMEKLFAFKAVAKKTDFQTPDSTPGASLTQSATSSLTQSATSSLTVQAPASPFDPNQSTSDLVKLVTEWVNSKGGRSSFSFSQTSEVDVEDDLGEHEALEN